LPVKIHDIPKASLWLHGESAKGEAFRGNAVAVTANRALSALQGRIMEQSQVRLIDVQGFVRRATVKLSRFKKRDVDMVLLELDAGETPFDTFIEIRREKVEVLQPLLVVGLTSDSADETKIYGVRCAVIVIDAGALFLTDYPLSGSAIFVSADTAGGFRLVGVPVKAQDDTSSPPPIHCSKTEKVHATTAENVQAKSNSSAYSFYGHPGVGVICEVARVPDILSAMQ